MVKRITLISFIFSLILIFFSQCKPDLKDKEFVLKIRIADEPDCLHPVVSQSSLATQIEILMMPPLFEFSLDKLEFSPILIKTLNYPEIVNDSTISYSYQILDQAVWDDEKPVCANDIIYTVKSSLNPCIKNKTYAGFFKNIRDFKSDTSDPKKIIFFINKNYMQSQEMSGNYCIYPEHVYDENLVLRNFGIQELLHKDSASWTIDQWNILKNYADIYQSQKLCKEKITGCGPYRLLSWKAGSKIILERKKHWWGDTLFKNYPLLTAYPDKIEYWIMPEESSALLELKNGNIDLVSDITPKVFEELKSKETGRLNFSTPTLMQYMYIEINHRNPILKDLTIRKCLSQLLDIDRFIKEQYFGYAVRINSPIHPSKSYYNKSLTPYTFQPEKAAELLKVEGWIDSNKDGSLDKIVNGKKMELSFNLLITNKETSKKLALLFQEEAKKIGIKIELVIKEGASFIKDLNELNFDLALMSARQSPSLWDPYQSFSSENAKPGGFNKSGYFSPKSDSLILAIRSASSDDQRFALYQDMQKLLHDDIAQIFMFSPSERIAYNKQLELKETSRRPGYYEGLIKRK